MSTLPATYPGTSVISLGQSYNRNPLNVLKIDVGRTGKMKGIWFNGGIHAREWITTATVMWMADKLLSSYSTDTDVKNILDTFVVYVMPVFNVDGYAFSWTNDRMWKKNRSPNVGSLCIGTDLNSNFDYGWGLEGASHLSCSNTFCGNSPASELETKAVSQFLRSNSHILKGFIDFHSYGQLWMFPWGYTDALPSSETALKNLATACTGALTGVHGTRYEVGTTYETEGVASGLASDWAYSTAGIKYSFYVELRGTDTDIYGFLLPADQIQPSGEETYAALKAFAVALMKNS